MLDPENKGDCRKSPESRCDVETIQNLKHTAACETEKEQNVDRLQSRRDSVSEGKIIASCAMKHGVSHHIQMINMERVFVFIRKLKTY